MLQGWEGQRATEREEGEVEEPSSEKFMYQSFSSSSSGNSFWNTGNTSLPGLTQIECQQESSSDVCAYTFHNSPTIVLNQLQFPGNDSTG